LAGWGKRIAALFVDWIIANVVATLILGGTAPWNATGGQIWIPVVCWAVLVWLATAYSGASLGQHILRLRVIRLDRRPVGAKASAIRTVLIALIIPPLILDLDGRGFHDLTAGTAVVNGPR
jgi:uncharacterized RDD family membrane protein YckC